MDIEKMTFETTQKNTERKLNPFRVLLIDDDKALLLLLNEFFMEKNFETDMSESAEDGLDKVLNKQEGYDLIICDLNLPEKNGIDFIHDLQASQIKTPVILITAYGTIDDAATALKQGAYDYITKPLNFTELEVLSQRAIKIQNLEKSYEKLKQSSVQKIWNGPAAAITTEFRRADTIEAYGTRDKRTNW